jgi:hypothetical protein
MAISRTQLMDKVKRRLGAPMVKVELCDEQIIDHIDYARQKWIKWAIGEATQETYFTVLLQAGKRFYDLPAGVQEVVSYDDSPIQSGGINTLFTMDNFMFQNGFYGNVFWGGYDLISYHIVLDFMQTLSRYRSSPYNWKYHKSTNQLEINPAPPFDGRQKAVTINHPVTGLPTQMYVDSPGWVLLRTYMVEGSTLPNYTPDWSQILKERKTIVEQRTLTALEIENKSLQLNHTPLDDTEDKSDFNVEEDTTFNVGGVSMVKGRDWNFLYENPRVIYWTDLTLDGTLVVGDQITVTYPVVFESQHYPDEWDDVTATSTEVEQYVITPAHLAEGYIRLQKNVLLDNIKISIGGVEHDFEEDFIVRDNCFLTWAGLNLEAKLEEGDVMVVTYVTATSYKPSGGSTAKQHGIKKQYTTKIENFNLTQEQVDQKGIYLEEDISMYDGVKLSAGGFVKIQGIDFIVDPNDPKLITWVGRQLDGVMDVDDAVTVTYTSAEPIITELEESLYDEDWILDYVTALSKISLGMIRRKPSSFSGLGSQGVGLDGDSLISEGKEEKEYLEETLRDEEASEGYQVEHDRQCRNT